MNLEEYKRRIENAHTVTGVPTYWEDLQKMKAERDLYQYIAKMFYDQRFAQDRDAIMYASAKYEEALEKSDDSSVR